MIRSYQVSQCFADKLKEIQKKSKEDGIAKTQEQILDEMMEIYLQYLKGEMNIYITEEMEKSVLNLCNLYLTKQVQVQNSMMNHLDEKLDLIIRKI